MCKFQYEDCSGRDGCADMFLELCPEMTREEIFRDHVIYHRLVRHIIDITKTCACCIGYQFTRALLLERESLADQFRRLGITD